VCIPLYCYCYPPRHTCVAALLATARCAASPTPRAARAAPRLRACCSLSLLAAPYPRRPRPRGQPRRPARGAVRDGTAARPARRRRAPARDPPARAPRLRRRQAPGGRAAPGRARARPRAATAHGPWPPRPTRPRRSVGHGAGGPNEVVNISTSPGTSASTQGPKLQIASCW
jgi:hypothetical protein